MKKSLLLLFALGVCPAFLSAQSKSPDLSGYWELRFDSRNVPPASLAAAATAADHAAQLKHDADAIRWCHFFGVPYMMAWSPMEIVQNSNGKEIAITSPVRTPARHIYTDGRPHVSSETFDPTSTGNSIGHWEGDTLVVDTIGFSDEGILAIPGGGHRTATSHLMERFRLLNGGQRLSVVFTWEDPNMYAKPHTYEFRYFRAPPGTEAREYDCNASDEERAKFLTGTPGK
jgi:hypothetical protein